MIQHFVQYLRCLPHQRRTGAFLVVCRRPRFGVIALPDGCTAEKVAANDGAVFLSETAREFLHQMIVRFFGVRVGRVGVALDKPEHHGRAADGAAYLAHSAQAAAEGRREPCRCVGLQARHVRKRYQDCLRAVVAVAEELFRCFTVPSSPITFSSLYHIRKPIASGADNSRRAVMLFSDKIRNSAPNTPDGT